MTEQFKKDLELVIEYLWDDELRHWQESDRPKEHIFPVLKRIKKVLKAPA